VWAPADPRPRLLELRREPEERRFAEGLADELDADIRHGMERRVIRVCRIHRLAG